MKEEQKSIQFILDSIEQGNISAQAGFRMIKSLKAGKMVESKQTAGEAESGMVYFDEYLEMKPISDQGKIVLKDSDVLLFSSSDEIINAYKKTFGSTINVIFVRLGNKYVKISDNEYSIDFSDLQQYKLLLNETVRNSQVKIINFMCPHSIGSGLGDIAKDAYSYLYNLFLLTKAVFEKDSFKSIHLINACLNNNEFSDPVFAALGSFAKSAAKENSKLMVKTIEFRSPEFGVYCSNSYMFAEMVLKELNIMSHRSEELVYMNGTRYCKEFKTSAVESASVGIPTAIKRDGVYVITGGLGSVGRIVARHFAGKERVKLVLCGRSSRNSNGINSFINEIKDLGSEAVYMETDVSEMEDVNRLVNEVHKKFGRIDGIVHCAGVLRDSLIINKSPEDFKAVMAPKILGAITLDLAIREDKPDFFILFSSIVAVMGNIGQADYSAANRFMDEYALMRGKAVEKDGVNRLYSSINWPLWEEGTMGVKEDEISFLKEAGLKAMPSIKAVEIFDRTLEKGLRRLIAGYGNTSVIESVILKQECVLRNKDDAGVASKHELIERTEGLLKEIFSDMLKIPQHNIESDIEFREYGIDSILVRSFNKKIEQKIGNISRTLLYEYDNIHELSRYLAAHYEKELMEILSLLDGKNQVEEKVEKIKADERNFSVHSSESFRDMQGEEDIAVIGVSGRYPMAENIDELWNNLKDGRDCITEIPSERWDINSYYHPDAQMAGKGKMYCKWGAFVAGADKFDPLFFNISPREAELMDPQERLFLETVWELMEEAGYTSSRLREFSNGDKSSNVGVFAGVTTNSYQLWGPEEWKAGRMVIPNSLQWSLANRVSYFFNFRGPSMPVDTACSASLTAVHLACESLKRKECEMAIVGGVNLYLHPSKYIYLCQLKMLSPRGRCHTFGEKSDGFVPGEGCGAILLKPLSMAERDKDRILAVIKSTAVNHGGSTSGYTVPNPNAQAALIQAAINKAGISARSISYIEAHGTGTALGDPIEVSALTKAFENYTSDRHFCSIGSVKTNIGHLEAAAGIAGITKLILQLKYGMLVPSLHAEKQNPNIDFINSPFYVQQDLKEWERPKLYEAGEMITCPRRAGISSFGAGGANAHIIFEEYVGKSNPITSFNDEPQLIVLSARNEERLREYALNISKHLDKIREQELGDVAGLADIAFTLGQCREAMEERLGAVVSNKNELIAMLKAYGSGAKNINGLFTGRVEKSSSLINTSKSGNQGDSLTNDYTREQLQDIARQWCSRGNMDLRKLFGYGPGTLVPLPTYPFEKRRCWYDSIKVENAVYAPDSKITEKDFGTVNPDLKNGQFPGNSMSVMKPLAEKYTGNAVKYEIKNDIAIVTMNDRESKNMFTTNLHLGLLNAFMKIEQNTDIKAVVLTGYDNIFCMGGTREQLDNISNRLTDCSDTEFAYRGLLECRVPVIAAIQGHAMGGGLILGLFADIIIMAKECVYSSNFTQYGFTPGVGATFILKEKMGAAISNEMMFTAKSYTGNDLKERGANILFRDAGNVLNEALTIAGTLAKKPRETLEVLKTELAGRTLKVLPFIIRSEISMHRKVFSKINTQENINKYFNTVFDINDPIGDISSEESSATAKPHKEESGIYQSFQENRIDRVKKNTSKLNCSTDQGENKMGKGWELSGIKRKLVDILCAILHVSENEVNTVKSFKDLGVDSISGVEIIRDVNKTFSTNLDAIAIYDYSTVTSLAGLVLQETGMDNETHEIQETEEDVQAREDDGILRILRDLKDKRLDIDMVEQLLEETK